MKSEKQSPSKRSRIHNIITFEDYLDIEYGHIGSPGRDEYEDGFKHFKLGILLQDARLAKGLTQEELAKKCGTNKGYISKIENNIKEARLSTLKRIVEVGLGGTLKVIIKL